MDTNYVILIFICGNLWKSIHTEAMTPTNSSHILSSTKQSSVDAKNTEEITSVTTSFQPITFNGNTADAKLQLSPDHGTENVKTESNDMSASWIAALAVGGILVLMLIAIIIIIIWKCVVKSVSVDPNWAGRSPFADGENPAELSTDQMQVKKRTSLAYIGSLPFIFQKSQHLLDDCSIQDHELKQNMDQMQSTLRREAENTKIMNGIHVPSCSPAAIRPDDQFHLTEPFNSVPPPLESFDLSSSPPPPPNPLDVSNPQATPTDSSDLSIPSPPPPDSHGNPNSAINELPSVTATPQSLTDSHLLPPPPPPCHQNEDQSQSEFLPPPPPEVFQTLPDEREHIFH
ncbi:protein EVI2B [Rhinatrema bivittatum]|uniref:protein EVI2B n=1 Tax=Rhinatrema bivittatum TaxID=194408 RepID=UPI00112E292E|nr:protein EVI2B [Rhinatrema bivittatum]XP_029467784.1 protein EVI2B [Rhinatrema bivittatum]